LKVGTVDLVIVHYNEFFEIEGDFGVCRMGADSEILNRLNIAFTDTIDRKFEEVCSHFGGPGIELETVV
jgi:hypothetical protein